MSKILFKMRILMLHLLKLLEILILDLRLRNYCLQLNRKFKVIKLQCLIRFLEEIRVLWFLSIKMSLFRLKVIRKNKKKEFLSHKKIKQFFLLSNIFLSGIVRQVMC